MLTSIYMYMHVADKSRMMNVQLLDVHDCIVCTWYGSFVTVDMYSYSYRLTQSWWTPVSTVNLAYNHTRQRGIRLKVCLFAKCRYTRSLIIMYYSWMELCSGHGNSVVIRELSSYPQSLLAKLTAPDV